MRFEPVVEGFAFLEAPRADCEGSLTFADVMLGGVYRLDAGGAVTTVLPDRKWVGGLALNRDGALIGSGHGGLWRFDPATGREAVLLAEIDGRPIPAVNDIQPDGRGGLYFGTVDTPALQAGRTPQPGALYRLGPGGAVTLLRDGLTIANGIGVSPDGRRLYQSDTWVGVWASDMAADGSILRTVLLAEQADCDGLAVDAEGGVWVAACRSGQLVRYRPDGSVERRVTLPVQEVLSLSFGGRDGRDLYVTTSYPGSLDLDRPVPLAREGRVYRARSDIPGQPLALTCF